MWMEKRRIDVERIERQGLHLHADQSFTALGSRMILSMAVRSLTHYNHLFRYGLRIHESRFDRETFYYYRKAFRRDDTILVWGAYCGYGCFVACISYL